MHAHIGSALIVRRAARRGDAAASPTEVPGQNCKIVAEFSDFGRIIEPAAGDRRANVRRRVEDHRGGISVLDRGIRPDTTRGIEHGGALNFIARDSSGTRNFVEIVVG